MFQFPTTNDNPIFQFNRTYKEPILKGTVGDIFHHIAEEVPDNDYAIFHKEDKTSERLTFKQVDTESTQIANFLQDKIPWINNNIGISLTRGNRLITSLFGVIKSGNVVVELEDQASESLNYQIENANISYVMVDNQTQHLFANSKVKTINLDDPAVIDSLRRTSKMYHSAISNPDDPAYLMYTSGTTGKPKAPLLSHKSFSNTLNALLDFKFKMGSKVLSVQKNTFDAFFWDLLVALVTRGEFHFTYEKGRYSPEVLNTLIRQEKINFIVLLPEILDMLNTSLPLEYIVSMGAAPHLETFKRWEKANPFIKIYNGLGHTETGICLSLHQHQEDEEADFSGPPNANMQTLILNPETLELCSIGTPGEIFVAGAGVALEYFGNPELTAKKFLYLEFDELTSCWKKSSKENKNAVKVFASGDIGYYQYNKSKKLDVKFLGRKDRQIKINGVNVDLDALEKTLLEHEEIKGIAVLPYKENTSLIAYIVPKNENVDMNVLRKELHHYLNKKLFPKVAYPRILVSLDALPLNRNGKVHYAALPKPEIKSAVEPQNQLQDTLFNIFAEALGLPKELVDANTSFEDLGGNSIQLGLLEIMVNYYIPLTFYAGINILSPDMTITTLEKIVRPLLRKGPKVIVLDNNSVIIGDEVHYLETNEPTEVVEPSMTNFGFRN